MIHSYWPYYFSLEADVENLSRYVEFTESNYGTYSIEMTRLYLAICSEIDVVLKSLCTVLGHKTQNINGYRDVIIKEIPTFCTEHVISAKYSLRFSPWVSWNAENTEKQEKAEAPQWWRMHNKVKHRRNEYYQEANLKNVLESLSALYLAIMHLVFVEERKISPEFTYSLSHIIPKTPIQQDTFRIDDNLAYYARTEKQL